MTDYEDVRTDPAAAMRKASLVIRQEAVRLEEAGQTEQAAFARDAAKGNELIAEAIAAKDKRIAELKERKDGAYLERNRCVALLAALLPSVRCRTSIEGWDPEWHGCVFIQTVEGQLSWHYHDSHEHLFAHVPWSVANWDGHSTPEKYERVRRLCRRYGAASCDRVTGPDCDVGLDDGPQHGGAGS